jgi:hypothetical protein
LVFLQIRLISKRYHIMANIGDIFVQVQDFLGVDKLAILRTINHLSLIKGAFNKHQRVVLYYE